MLPKPTNGVAAPPFSETVKLSTLFIVYTVGKLEPVKVLPSPLPANALILSKPSPRTVIASGRSPLKPLRVPGPLDVKLITRVEICQSRMSLPLPPSTMPMMNASFENTIWSLSALPRTLPVKTVPLVEILKMSAPAAPARSPVWSTSTLKVSASVPPVRFSIPLKSNPPPPDPPLSVP